MPQHDPTPERSLRWPISLAGLALAVVAVVALAGPGRIDVIDGQTRYEAARSLVEHGDSAIRDPKVTFNVYPGRDGLNFTEYRFPQTLLGAVAILAADATGPVGEPRRHFAFSLIGAFACGALAVVYACWFRGRGHSPRASIGWAAAGIGCTPCFFYGTSSFDDILGTAFVVPALAIARTTRGRSCLAGAIASGLLLGLAFNGKPPLGAFTLAAILAHDDPARSARSRLLRAGLIAAGLAAGIAACVAYDRHKFPPEARVIRAEIIERDYVPIFRGDPVAALVSLAISPGAGVLWYAPAAFLGLAGLARLSREAPRFAGGLRVGLAIVVAFLATLTFFKGDPAWGPRYLTPLIGLLWLFAPEGAARLGRCRTALLLAAGLTIQLLGLAVDAHRLYVERGMPAAFYFDHQWVYFDSRMSHLFQRPREIWETFAEGRDAREFSPAPVSTAAVPMLGQFESGVEAVRRYRIFDAPRPWPLAYAGLPPTSTPIDVDRTLALMAGLLAVGVAMLAATPGEGRC